MSNDDRYAALRAEIVARAETHIARAGLAGLRARDLAQAAGCALGTLYNAFKDIDDIILAVNARTLTRLGDKLWAETRRVHDPAKLIAALGTVYVAFAFDEANLWRALFNHQMSSGRDVPDDYIARYDSLFRVLEEPIATLAAARAQNARDLSRTLFSAVHGITMLGLERKIETVGLTETETRLRVFLEIFIDGLTRTDRQAR
jgi:AcrR family transcriptional regulator